MQRAASAAPSPAPDVRKALSAHRCLHSSIFDGSPSSWDTEDYGHFGGAGTACDTYSRAAVIIDPSQLAKQLHLGSLQDCCGSPEHIMDLSAGDPSPGGSAWSPGGTHFVQAMVCVNRQNTIHKLQLALLRMRDGARTVYTVETLDLACKEIPVLQVLWDPSASQDRPRLAVVRASNKKVRPWQTCWAGIPVWLLAARTTFAAHPSSKHGCNVE